MLRSAAMRAAYYERVGPAREVLTVGELPTPVPGPGEVRVRVHFSGVNPSDVKTRNGMRGGALPFPRIVPHSDGAGFIDAVGMGVDEARIGERVWLWNAGWKRANGTAAEYVTLPQEQAVELPAHIDLAAGACLGIPALTAYHAVACGGGVTDKTVLVAGGAGAVGHYAVQLAKSRGRETRSSPPSAVRKKPRSRDRPGPISSSTTARKISWPAAWKRQTDSASSASSRSTWLQTSREISRSCGPTVTSSATAVVHPRSRCRFCLDTRQRHVAFLYRLQPLTERSRPGTGPSD